MYTSQLRFVLGYQRYVIVNHVCFTRFLAKTPLIGFGVNQLLICLVLFKVVWDENGKFFREIFLSPYYNY